MLPAVVALLLAPAPRLDAEGFPLPPEAVRRFGSLRWYADPPRSVAFSPDGKAAYLVPTDYDWFLPIDRAPTVTAWEYPSGRPLWSFTDTGLSGLTVAADPDGKAVWLAGLLGRRDRYKAFDLEFVRVKLSAATGRELARVKLGRGWCHAHALRPDGTLAWNRYDRTKEGEGDLTIRVLKPDGIEGALWDPDTAMGVTELKFAPDGKTLFVYGPTDQENRGRLAAVDPATGKKKWAVESLAIDTLAVSPDGKTLAAVTCSPRLPLPRDHKDFRDEEAAGYLARYDAATGETKLSVRLSSNWKNRFDHRYNPPYLGRSVGFTPDSKTVLVREHDSAVVTVDADEWLKGKSRADHAVNGVYAPDGTNYLVTGKQYEKVLPLDAASHKPLANQPDPLPQDRDLTFTPDGKRVRVGLVEFDFATGKELERKTWRDRVKEPFTGVVPMRPSREVISLRSPDGNLLLRTCKEDPKDRRRQYTLEVVNAKTEKEVAELPPTGAKLFAFTPDSKRIIAMNVDGTVYLWDAEKGGEPKTEPRLNKAGGGSSNTLLRVADGYAVIAEPNWGYDYYDPKTRWSISRFPFDGFKREKTWTGKGAVEDIAIAPGGEVVGWARVPHGNDQPDTRMLFVIDPGADEPREYPLAPGTGFAVSPDGRTAAFGVGSGDIELYETATGKRRHTFTGLKRIVNSLAYSPDGTTLLSESPDGPVILWDVRGDTLQKLNPDAAGWDELFRELGGDDAEAAFRAVRRFAVHPDGPAELAKRVGKPNAVLAERSAEVVRLANTDVAKKVLAAWAKGEKDNPLTAAAKK